VLHVGYLQLAASIPSTYLHKNVTLNTKRHIKQTITHRTDTLILNKTITTHFCIPFINASVNETSDTLSLCLLFPVVWNPWQEKAAAMADLGDDDYVTMVCVEAGAVATPHTLAPSHSFQARQTFVVSA